MSEPLEILAESREYVLVPWDAKVAGEMVDPSGFTAAMAFVAPDVRPEAGDWKPAGWEADETGGWNAACLVGAGGAVELSVGTYRILVRTVGPTSEVPVKEALGWLKVI